MSSSGISAADYSKLTFTAPEDNYYTFHISEDTDKTVLYTKNGSSSTSNLTLYSESTEATTLTGVALTKGDYITLNVSSVTSGTITVTKRSYTALTLDIEKSISLDSETTEKWYSFTAPETGVYTLTLTENNKKASTTDDSSDDSTDSDATDDSSDDSTETTATVTYLTGKYATTLATASASNTISDDGTTLSMAAGDVIAICVSTDIGADSTLTASGTLKVTQSGITALSEGTSDTFTVEKSGGVKWLSFEAAEDGAEYVFNYTYAEDSTTTVNESYYGADMKSTMLSNDAFSGEKGDVIYIKLYTDSTSDADAKLTVTITKTEAETISAGTPKTTAVTSGSKKFYQFTATEYGLYSFTATAATTSTDEDPTVRKITSKTYSTASVTETGTEFMSEGTSLSAEKLLAKGESIIFSIEGSSGTASDTTATVTVAKVTTDTALPGTEISLSSGETKWYKYTATDTDTYKFSWTADDNISVSYGASLSSGANTTAKSGMTQSLSKGESLYFKVKNTNADTTADAQKITFTVASATETAVLGTNTYNVTADDEGATYVYTATEAGRYTVSYTFTATSDTSTSEIAAVNSTTESEKVPASITPNADEYGEYVLGIGDKLTLTISNFTSAGTLVFTIKQVTPSTGTESIAAGSAQWFEVTIPATGRYTVAATYKDSDGNTQNVTSANVNYTTDLTTTNISSTLSSLNEHWFTKGDVYYVRVESGDEKLESVSVSFTQISATALTLGTAVTPSLKEGDTVYYAFTAEDGELYSVKLEGTYGSASYFVDGNSNSLSLSNGSTISASKNVGYMIKLTGTGDEASDVKLTVTHETATVEAGSSKTVTLTNGATGYVRFTAPKTGYYAFYLADIPDGVTVTGTLSNNTVYTYSKITLLSKKTFTLQFTWDTDSTTDTKTVTLYAEEINPTDITESGSFSFEAAKGVYQWFSYTAPEYGRYTFKDNSSDVSVQYKYFADEVKANSSSNYTSGTLPTELVLNKGDVKVFAVYYTELASTGTAESVPATAKFTVSVAKVEPSELKDGEQSLTIAAGSDGWYSYTAAADGVYTFAFTAADDADVTVEKYSSLTTNSSTIVSGGSTTLTLSADDTVYFKITNNSSSASAGVTVNVTSETEAMEEVETGSNTVAIAGGV